MKLTPGKALDPTIPHEGKYEATPVLQQISSRAAEDDTDETDEGPNSYQWLQLISGQISKAQSGQGPLRKRYFEIAVLALRAINSIDRSTK